MKIPPVKFRFVVLGVIVIVAIVSCCPFPSFPLITGTTSYAAVEIGGKQRTPTYVEWKDKAAFENALAQVHARKGGKICICVLESPGGTPYPHKLNNDCTATYRCPSEKIRTVKVTKSKAADNIAAGGSVANDPNVTWRIQSPDPGDINAVLGTLATPTPIPAR
jgi:hypothetical protein